MEQIIFRHPGKIVFGMGSLRVFLDDCQRIGVSRLYIITIPPLERSLKKQFAFLQKKGIETEWDVSIEKEPAFDDVLRILKGAERFRAGGVVGIGGGSVLDVAKLTAALLGSSQEIDEVVGIDLIKGRDTYLACIPTTSGTGSEVSPNAIFIDTTDGSKKGVISRYLVPDAAYIDPDLTLGVPPDVTASTGIDALTHCIEAFTNRFAHPITDMYALEGIRLIGGNLKQSVENGNDMEARTNVALGSLYGGMCLGPVNTAAVHALAYPLGTIYKLPHGLSNAILLPHVMRFNLPGCIEKFYKIAIVLGVKPGKDKTSTAGNGISYIEMLLDDCRIPRHLSRFGVQRSDVDNLAGEAMKIQRLLVNNPREISLEEAKDIFLKAL